MKCKLGPGTPLFKAFWARIKYQTLALPLVLHSLITSSSDTAAAPPAEASHRPPCCLPHHAVRAARCLFSCVQLCESQWMVAPQAPLSLGFSRQEYWSGLSCPPQGIFPTQGSNPGLPHCRWTLYCLSHQEAQWSRATALTVVRIYLHGV